MRRKKCGDGYDVNEDRCEVDEQQQSRHDREGIIGRKGARQGNLVATSPKHKLHIIVENMLIDRPTIGAYVLRNTSIFGGNDRQLLQMQF